MWASQNPGDKIHFRFRGAGFGLFDFSGPDAGMEAEIAKPKYRGQWIRASHLMIRGQIVEE